jgi:hypothetical protein
MTETTNIPVANELSSEEKILLEHQLSLRRLLIDRLLIGLLLALAAFLASLAIERFKATSSDTRYFLEKRLEAGTEVRSKLTDVTSGAFEQTHAPCVLDLNARPSADSLKSSVNQLLAQLNSSALLFSKEYLTDADRVVNIFAGAAAEPSSISCDSRYFFGDIADYFTDRTKSEVRGTADNWEGYVPLELDKEAMDRAGAVDYFRRNQAAWVAARAKSSK